MQIYIPEARPAATPSTLKKLKWALKYNPEVISFDEASAGLHLDHNHNHHTLQGGVGVVAGVLIPTDIFKKDLFNNTGGKSSNSNNHHNHHNAHDEYAIADALAFACNYGRKVRIASW